MILITVNELILLSVFISSIIIIIIIIIVIIFIFIIIIIFYCYHDHYHWVKLMDVSNRSHTLFLLPPHFPNGTVQSLLQSVLKMNMVRSVYVIWMSDSMASVCSCPCDIVKPWPIM